MYIFSCFILLLIFKWCAGTYIDVHDVTIFFMVCFDGAGCYLITKCYVICGIYTVVTGEASTTMIGWNGLQQLFPIKLTTFPKWTMNIYVNDYRIHNKIQGLSLMGLRPIASDKKE